MGAFLASQIVFAGLALMVLVLLWSARPSRQHGNELAYRWLAGAVVAFVVMAIPIERFGYDFDAPDNAWWLRIVALALIVFPGLLTHAVCTLVEQRSWWLRLSDALTIVLACTLLLMPTFPGGSYPDPPLVYVVLVIGVVVEFLLACSISVIYLVRVAKGQPQVVRRRALFLSCTQLVCTMTFLWWLAAPSPWMSLVANCMLVIAATFMVAAIVWPHRLLRRRDVDTFNRWDDLGRLMAAVDVEDDLDSILSGVANTWGFLGIAFVDRDGATISIRGASTIDSDALRTTHVAHYGDMRAGEPAIVAWSTALTLPVTHREARFLTLLAMMIQFALDREMATRQQLQAARAASAAAESLAAANTSLMEADEMKNRFISLVSHELRTPLTSIVGLAQTAYDRWEELPQEQLRDFQRVIVEQGDRLTRIIENLLITSQIEGKVLGSRREQTNLQTLVHEAIVGSGIDETQVQVDIAAACTELVTGPLALHEILVNLLANVHKYGRAPILVRAKPISDAQVELVVRDSGDGVEPGIRDQIFERFVRGSDLDQSGTGLGLSIVRDLAMALEGESGYRPLGAGSEFWVRLPR